MNIVKILIFALPLLFSSAGKSQAIIPLPTAEVTDRTEKITERLSELEILEEIIYSAKLPQAKRLIERGLSGHHLFFFLFTSKYCVENGCNEMVQEFAKFLIEKGYNINEIFEGQTVLSRISQLIQINRDCFAKRKNMFPNYEENLKQTACFILSIGGTPSVLTELDTKTTTAQKPMEPRMDAATVAPGTPKKDKVLLLLPYNEDRAAERPKGLSVLTRQETPFVSKVIHQSPETKPTLQRKCFLLDISTGEEIDPRELPPPVFPYTPFFAYMKEKSPKLHLEDVLLNDSPDEKATYQPLVTEYTTDATLVVPTVFDAVQEMPRYCSPYQEGWRNIVSWLDDAEEQRSSSPPRARSCLYF